MLPVRDIVPSRTPAVAAGALVALLTAAFVVGRWGSAPADLGRLAARWVGGSAAPGAAAWLTGWLHFLTVVVPIWVLGRTLEDRMGHARFVAFLATCAALAAAVAALADPGGGVPLIGASGAAAGVLGGHLRLFPGGRVAVAWPLPGLARFSEAPTGLLAVTWLLLVLIAAAPGAGPGPDRAIVWSAVAGLLAGAALALRFRRRERDHPDWWDTLAAPSSPRSAARTDPA
jgi:hypothetical protein